MKTFNFVKELDSFGKLADLDAYPKLVDDSPRRMNGHPQHVYAVIYDYSNGDALCYSLRDECFIVLRSLEMKEMSKIPGETNNA